MTHSEKLLSTLIGDVYDAALHPSLWVDVLAQAAGFVGGSAAALFSKDAGSRNGTLVYEHGIEPRYQRLYLDEYIKLDPGTTEHHTPTGAATTRRIFSEVGKPIAATDLISYDGFLETRFYREWARPQGLVDFVGSVLDKSQTGAAMFGVFRHERDGLTDGETRRRMRLIVPHIRRALLIARLIDLKKAQAETFAETLDGLSAGMILVDPGGRIVHANAAGHAMLGDGDFLSGTGGRLAATDGQADQALSEIFAAASHGDAALGTRGIALPLTARDGERYVAHMLPLTSGARRRTGAVTTAAAALFVRRTSLETSSSPEVIARTYRLTPTELRVLFAIVGVGGVPEVAQALGVAESTVKTHLGRLFEKTGVSRQADLVKLVAGFSSPLVG